MNQSFLNLYRIEETKLLQTYIGLPDVHYGAWLNLIYHFYGQAMGVYSIALYTSLLCHKNHKTSEAYVGYETIALELQISKATVEKYLKLLESLGLIKIVWEGRGKKAYKVLLMPPFPPLPEIIWKYFPKGWEPSKTALKELNIFTSQNNRSVLPDRTVEKSKLSNEKSVIYEKSKCPASPNEVSCGVGPNKCLTRNLTNINKDEEFNLSIQKTISEETAMQILSSYKITKTADLRAGKDPLEELKKKYGKNPNLDKALKEINQDLTKTPEALNT